jgi:hypothetical protein
MTDSSNAANVAAGLQGGYNAKAAEIANSAVDQGNQLRTTVAQNREQLVGQLTGGEKAFEAGRNAMNKVNQISGQLNTNPLGGIISGGIGAYAAAEEGARYSKASNPMGGYGMFGGRS